MACVTAVGSGGEADRASSQEVIESRLDRPLDDGETRRTPKILWHEQ
jgi:hypothetical protein